jgi:fatty acid/phospholipid biosynthesis enzyme
VRVIDAPDVIDMCEPPAKALRKKPRASIRVAAEHVALAGPQRCSAPAIPVPA